MSSIKLREDTLHPIEEFNNFPWERCDLVWYKHNGSYLQLSDALYYIKFINSDGSFDLWEIPVQLATMLDMNRRFGADDLRDELKRVLKIS